MSEIDFKSYKFYLFCAKLLLLGMVAFSAFNDKNLTEQKFVDLIKVVSTLEE